MKKIPLLLGAALGIAVFLSGCETDGGVSARAQEKSAVYGSLKPWQKKYVDKGVVAKDFTPDMVYIAIGKPTTVENKETEAGAVEVWTYKNYYPTTDAATMRYGSVSGESHYQRQATGAPTAVSASRTPQSISTTGGPQGGTMEPADLQSYTFTVTFKDGKVSDMKLEPH